MENKLELKHLTPYLPYGLKIQDCNEPEMVWTLHYHRDALDSLIDTEHISLYQLLKENKINTNSHKPILRPLSDLTKEIEHDGKKFIPFIEMSETYKKDMNFDDFDPAKNINQSIILMREYGYGHCQTWVFEKLCAWHFDVFGLIEKGLAVPLT